MASLKNLTATFSTAVGPRRYILPSLAIAIGTLLDVGMLKFGILLDADGPFAYLPFAAGISIAAIMIIWWLLDYATKIRAEMGAIENIEQALNALSADFDEGNAKIFNGVVTGDAKYREWDARRDAWQEKVQEHLQSACASGTSSAIWWAGAAARPPWELQRCSQPRAVRGRPTGKSKSNHRAL